MSWISESTLNWTHLLFLKLLKCGTIPKHVAFIMDGNRRFARKNNVRKLDGHSKGFDKLSETLQWCLDMGVNEVTVYAFSIENFKRTKEEVDDLLGLTREKLKRLIQEKDTLAEKGVKIRIIGNHCLLPEDIMKLIAQAELITKDNDKAVLNVAFSYTAQDEMAHSIKEIVSGLKEKRLEESDVDMPLFYKCLYTRDSAPPDLIIRTSGESRLSDFLLCQGAYSYLHFTRVLWPELSPWDFLWAIFNYQMFSARPEHSRNAIEPKKTVTENGAKFLTYLDNRHFNLLEQTLKNSPCLEV